MTKDRYKVRLQSMGASRREREVKKKQDYILRNKNQNPSLKKVLIDGENRELFVNTGTKPYYKEIQSLPNEIFYSGQIVEWEDNHWLIMDSDSDDESYVDGTMDQCNWLLRWQNENLDIIERWVRIGEASAYNTGTKGDLTIELGYDQKKIYLPYDEETIKLKRGKRIFIDNNKEDPMPYEITRVDTVAEVYNNHGLVTAMFSESQFIEGEDNIELFICNYKEKEGINDDSYNYLYSKIESKSNYIIAGFDKGERFEGKFYINSDTLDEHVTPVWSISCDFIDKLNICERYGYITISTDDDSLIGRHFTLELYSSNNSYPPVSKTLEIVGIL